MDRTDRAPKKTLDCGCQVREYRDTNTVRFEEVNCEEHREQTRKCPRCGMVVKGNHSTNSNECIAWEARNMMKEKGLAPVPSKILKDCLKEKGVRLERGIIGYRPSAYKQSSSFVTGWYAPEEAIEELRGNIMDPDKPKQTTRRVYQDEKFLIVKADGKPIPFEKDEFGGTRRRKFHVQDGILYTNKGRRVGEKVEAEERPQHLEKEMTARRLQG